MDSECKERLFNRIKAEWNLPEGHDVIQVVENQCMVLYRQWRYRLKEEFFNGNSVADAAKNGPKDIDPDEWKWIVEKYWGTEKQKRKTRHLSATSQECETSEISLEAGDESLQSPPLQPEYLALWETTKRHKDHSMDKFAEEKLGELKQLHEQQIEQYGVDNLTIEEAYMKVLGTSSGYIKGLGFGPKPPKCRKDGTFSEKKCLI